MENTGIGKHCKTIISMENTGTYPTKTEKLASAINNLANAIDRLNGTSREPVGVYNPVTGTTYKIRRKSEDAGKKKRILEDTTEEKKIYIELNAQEMQELQEGKSFEWNFERDGVVVHISPDKVKDTTEEWEEEFRNKFATLLRKDFKIYARPIDNPQNAEGELGDIGEDIIDFIKQLLKESEVKAEAFDEMHDILKPYHEEAEYYPDTLRRVLAEIREEGYEEGKNYQARLDRELYGMSFEEFNKKYKPVSKLNKQ